MNLQIMLRSLRLAKCIIGCRPLVVCLLGVAALPAQAQLKIEITSGVTDPISFAATPFTLSSAAADVAKLADVAQVVQNDLERSGRFRALARGADYQLSGRVAAEPGGRLGIDFALQNNLTGTQLVAEHLSTDSGNLRDAAHRIADRIYQQLLGVRGAFATRIAYVSVDGRPPAQRFQLLVADADGANPRIVLESRQPIMSPAWSPDGEWLAYVSFEANAAAVFVQRVRSGERRRVSARVGINGAPAWSPDGKFLAVTLSGSAGNPDIYLLELATQNLTRLTDDGAIDTESVWAADGSALYFTSDRSGGPQIYRVEPRAGSRPQRVTFNGSYNARPRISPDGRQLAFVTREDGAYRIAVQDLGNGVIRVLSKGRSDESPSFAPNGAVIIFSGRERGASVLASVSVDGLATQRLQSDRGEVREPAWGPFLR